MLTNYLAELWGISLVVIAFAMLLKPKYLNMLFTGAEKEETLFLWGILTFLIGLAMVLAHNIWVKDWQVIITLFGWASLLKGLAILFFPEFFMRYAKKIENKQWLPIALVIAVFIGLIITYFGFTA